MTDLLHFAFAGANIIPTTLLIFVVAYWLVVIIGIIDIEAFDFDLEMDMDGDVEIGGLASVLSFFNIGEMPFMVFVTFFTLPLWVTTLVFNDLLGFSGFLSGMIIFIPAFLGSLFVAKVLTIPIARFYKKVKQNTEAVEEIIGKICTAKLIIGPERKGQAEIKVNGTSVLIYAKTRNETVEKGETALVIEFVKEENFYYVEPYKL